MEDKMDIRELIKQVTDQKKVDENVEEYHSPQHTEGDYLSNAASIRRKLDHMETDEWKKSQEEFSKRKAEETARSFNDRVGDLKYIDCPICKNKGQIARIREYPRDGWTDFETVIYTCQCMKKRRFLIKAHENGLGDYITKTFDNYIDKEDWQKYIKNKAKEYVERDDNKWWCMCGQSGCGKTLISSIISYYLLSVKNKNVYYLTWTDFISKLKRDVMTDNSREVSNYLEEVKNFEVLYIDELLKKYNETDLKYIIEIINYRYNNNLKTIISSERNLNELLDIDEATFGRVVEKSGEYLLDIKKDRNKNYRLKGLV